ncbi:MAG: GTPase ObgE [Paludibacteraceae bacterium]|nr:GTPase ObgE [Paludibacteraceae bacterium]MEE1095716.1 GTPase ObgE [Paludibacteraceae bacterium]MEE1254267.1 GTPase ObgE [Paludibacteraceae bacterium]
MSGNFIDYVKIYCRSGKGGAGCMHLHRAKYVPKGGPDGGDGGKGGSIILQGNRNLWTLLHLKYQKHIIATDGGRGGQSRSFGKDGEDKIIEVPCGTVIYDGETGEFICEVKEHNERVVLLKGGRGGLGNWHFRTATNQAPRYAQPGEPALERTVIMQLKVLADVGLVGFPNAGKSTLLSVVSAAKPEIADYPFTTLTPQLGIVSYRDGRSFCMADIPGIIEGASEGKGLGLRFLRHIERNAVLLFMVPAASEDIQAEYNILLNELEQYNPELLTKARILAISKMDVPRIDQEGNELPPITEADVTALSEQLGIPVVAISSLTGLGVDALKDVLWEELNKEQNQVIEISHAPIDVTVIEKAEEPANEDDNEEHTIYLNEVEEEWDLDKYKGIGWDN